MQVEVDVKCMHTNFGGCSLSSFGDIATLKNGQISLSDHGLCMHTECTLCMGTLLIHKEFILGHYIMCTHVMYITMHLFHYYSRVAEYMYIP